MTSGPPDVVVTAPRELAVIDDDADSRELFAEYLRLEGFSVLEFESAEDALTSFAARAPALILTDVTLSGMSGCEAAGRLRRDVTTRHIPLVAVTGRQAQDLREDRFLFDSVLVKPVNADNLVKTVRELLARAGS